MPRLKPPFPAEKGYWQKPTNINNVETYANVPWIIANGGSAFGAMGTEKSKGTKVFALAGKIKKGGLVEVPMGLPLKDVIFGIGGGIKQDKEFKAVQMGGPSGGCIPASLIDTPVTYEAVSYTHLDVYKRQRLHFLREKPGSESILERITGSISFGRRAEI